MWLPWRQARVLVWGRRSQTWVLSLPFGPTWSLSTPMCPNPLACQWNVKSTTRLSLNLVLHRHTIANIVSQQLSLPKYGTSWMSTSKRAGSAPVAPHTAHQLSSLEGRQVNCACWWTTGSDVQRETTGGKFPGNSRFPGNEREKFEPREFPSYGNFPGLGKFPCHGKFPYSRGHNFLTRYPNYNLKKPLGSS